MELFAFHPCQVEVFENKLASTSEDRPFFKWYIFCEKSKEWLIVTVNTIMEIISGNQ